MIDTCPWAPGPPVTVELKNSASFPLNYVLELPLALPTLTPTATSTPRRQACSFLVYTAADAGADVDTAD